MSKHTPGPLVSDSIEGAKDSGGRRLRLTGVALDGGSDEAKANTRLAVAAYNSYDKHCGPRAVECAEGDLLGELLEACKALLPFAHECMPPVGHICGPESQCDASCMDAAAIAQIIRQANAAIAKAEGGAK